MPIEPSAGVVIETALRAILRRDRRELLYADALTDDVDAVRYPVLSGIVTHGPISAAALGRMVGSDRSVVSRHVDHLERAGLVRRTPQGRVTRLEATDEGVLAVAGIHEALVGRIEEIMDGWPDTVRTGFVDGMQRFAASLEELAPPG